MAIITNDTSDQLSTHELSLLERVASLEDVIRRGGDEAQELRRCPSFVVDALVDAGLFRFTIPRELGGEDASVGQTIEVLEAISAIDASVGWNVMLGSEINAMAAGGMAKELAEEVYLANPGVIMCGGGGPGTTPSRAVAQPDGSYRIWGHTTFISGCHNATWCFMVAPVFDGDEVRLTNGVPTVKLWMLHRDEWEILDTWDVAGLRGSGSHDVVTEGGLVPERFAGVDLVTVPALYENPVYRIPVPLRLAYNKAAVAIGIARGALDEFAVLANAKTPMLSSTPLRDRPVAQYRMGEGEANLRAARAFLFEAMGQVEDELWAGREAPSAGAHADRPARVHPRGQRLDAGRRLDPQRRGHVGDADGQPARTQAARRTRRRDPPLGRAPAVRRARQDLPRPRSAGRVRRHRRAGTRSGSLNVSHAP